MMKEMHMMKMIALALVVAGCTAGPGADDTRTPPATDTSARADAPSPDTGEPGPAPAPEATCGISGDAALTGEGVGAFEVGAEAGALLVDCPAATDTTIRDVEGMMQRVIELPRQQGMVRAMIVDGAVWRVHVTDPSVSTADGISVGTTLGELLERDGARGMMGEGRLFVALPAHCGMSFGLDTAPGEISRTGDWTAERLAELPSTTPINEILAFGC